MSYLSLSLSLYIYIYMYIYLYDMRSLLGWLRLGWLKIP